MILDLTRESLYAADALKIEKKYTFLFGKNGTGKSTITNIINTQCKDTHDVRIFSGFDDVVDSELNLNAVVLGKENSEIKRQIEVLEAEILKLETEKAQIEKSYRKPLEDETKPNLYTEYEKLYAQKCEIEDIIEGKLRAEAAKIKKMENPRFVSTSYNILNIKRDIESAIFLSKEETEEAKRILKSDVKIVDKIDFPQIDIANCIARTNKILTKYVEERVHVERVGTDPKKVDFAKQGISLHKPGDVCIFCGGIISEKAYKELKTYFSADEVKTFQKEMTDEIDSIVEMQKTVDSLKFDKTLFYPMYIKDIAELGEKLIEYKNNAGKILSRLNKELIRKQAALFIGQDELSFDFDDTYNEICLRYNEVVKLNNANDIKKRQEEARAKLLYGAVYNALDNIKYTELLIKKERACAAVDFKSLQMQKEKDKVSGPGGIDEKLKEKRNAIINLKKQTRDEIKLAKEISKKLKNLVSFELEYIPAKDEQLKGLYKIKDSKTGEIRNVTDLSTGEKNIIAFLYFIGKLNEINEDVDGKAKLIVFDDPMNSNDDNMQYLMMGELDQLMKQICEDDSQFILLTHNIHFYININYSRKKDNQADFLHLEKISNKTVFNYVTGRKDFKTSYESLWDELKFLYHNEDAGPDLLLNPARRIFETYIKFNGLDSGAFYKDHVAEKKLFDVNSHSIDDLNADLNSNTKEQIIAFMRGCFVDNYAQNHFEAYWDND